MRSALLTPWFAVSVGIVIATSLTLATPHPALTFPPSQIGHCAKAGCSSRSMPPSAPQPADKREARLPQPDANVRSAVKLEYQLLPKNKNHFMAVIVIVGRKPLGRWSLRFVLPGAHIESIMWAKWQREGTNGVLVTGSPLPWPRSGQNEVRVVVFGTGAPGSPTGCMFDGASCKFRMLSADSPHQDGSRNHGQRPQDRYP